MNIEELHPSLAGQVMNLILSIKKSCLNFVSEDKLIGWNNTVYFAQLFAHVLKVIAQRLYMNLEVKLLTDFITTLASEFTNTQ